jgi:hypothetical protein
MFRLDEVERKILDARCAAAYGNATAACQDLARAIELLRAELEAMKVKPKQRFWFGPK